MDEPNEYQDDAETASPTAEEDAASGPAAGELDQ